MSTYTPIASVTLSSAQSSVTFSGIPQTYTDLVLVFNGSMTATSGMLLQLNSDTGTNYSDTILYGTGSAATSIRDSSVSQIYAEATGGGTTDQHTQIFNFQNYSNSTTNKTILVRNSKTNAEVGATVGLWRNTAAITTIKLFVSSNNFASGSTFNLYGVANASITNVAKATGGDSVYTDGTYWYHIFRSSGTFTPTQALTADYLVVAGGGGGGSGTGNYGGGGGAGGLRSTVTATGGGGSLESALSLIAQAYTVTVGAGGAAGVSANKGSQGSNSVFSTITSTGGGFGGGETTNISGGDGGSGGGRGGGAGTAGNGTANQGYAGSTAASGIGGGGGGAGSAASGSTAGAGVAVSISGSSVTYAAGGRGTTGGTTPEANSGGGGLGALSNTAGGSGIVIVRYAI